MGGVPPPWVLEILAPTLGVIICNIMWLTPARAVWRAAQKRDLGTLNPVPYAVTVCNCLGWVIYGCMRRDYFIFFANFSGLICGVGYSLSALVLLQRKKIDAFRFNMMFWGLMATAAFWGLMGMIACIVFDDDPASREQGIVFIGVLGMGFGLLYYTSPLSTLLKIVRQRDASSLYLPLIVTSFLNASLWVVYGFAKRDTAIWLPNVVGMALCTVQFLIKVLIPATKFPLPAALDVSKEDVDAIGRTVESPLFAESRHGDYFAPAEEDGEAETGAEAVADHSTLADNEV